ncbi:ABC transporter permease subunit [Natrarchaeobaculum aegyptiacum]|uniref:Uncharacterized protein n=1 Tax=Natrarchaeobaculum aegyptiacum TaxID=745377 RepID=A0A2Z2I333_9EURY|nr:ABC transporter permease subunit [Natrarchaeobaculum aegyptiacum]ARS91578.1 hypothetical protein B1756_18850 [Natrarchaeobaculum aegyptiacum]
MWGMLYILLFEIRRHLRAKRTVASACVLVMCYLLWISHSLRITTFEETTMITMLHFQARSLYEGRVILTLARDPLLLLFVICTPLLFGATTVAGHRDTGTLRLLQSLPYSRWTVFVGLVAARVAMMSGIICLLMMGALLETWRQGVPFSPVHFAGYTAVLLAITATLVVVGAAISARATSRRRAYTSSLLFGFLIIFVYSPLQALRPEVILLTPRAVYYALVAGIDIKWATTFQARPSQYRLDSIYHYTEAAVLSLCAWLFCAAIAGLYSYRNIDITIS